MSLLKYSQDDIWFSKLTTPTDNKCVVFPESEQWYKDPYHWILHNFGILRGMLNK